MALLHWAFMIYKARGPLCRLRHAMCGSYRLSLLLQEAAATAHRQHSPHNACIGALSVPAAIW
jgi:hypothetical protein